MKTLGALLIIPIALSNFPSLAQSPTITTVVGPNLPSSGSQAITQTIGVPEGVTSDGTGGLYVTSSQHRVYRVTSDGTLIVIAGTGSPGFGGDGGLASSARLNYVHGIAVDNSGNVFIADTNNGRIRKITPEGIIGTVAGTGGWGSGGDGGPAVSAHLAAPRGVTVDSSGNLFIADTGNNEIRMVTPAGIITTVAGNGSAGSSGDGGPATSAELNYPVAIAVDSSGNLYIADRHNNRIRMVNSEGVITTFAGSTPGFSGDGNAAVYAQILDPRGVAVDPAGNVFIADTGNNRIRRVNPAGIISTVAGSTAGFDGDGGPADLARLALPVGVAVDGAGNVFIADRGNYRVRLLNAAGIIASVAGMNDDGGPASSAQLNYPTIVAADGAGNLFIADTDSQRIRKVSANGVITTVAGNGAAGFSGDGGSAVIAQLNYPGGVAVDATGNLFIADTKNQRIRKVTPGGIIITIAGNGKSGFIGDGGPATQAQLSDPAAVTADASGNLFITDSGNQRVRKIDSSGIMTTVAGDGTKGFGGDGGPALSAQLNNPVGLVVNAAGNIFVADSGNNRIRAITVDGNINTIAGDGTYGFGGDGGAATAAHFAYPNGIAVDGSGNLFVADTDNYRIRKLTSDGVITTVAGNGSYGFSGDGGVSTSAQLAAPFSVAVDSANSLVVADTYSSRIRKVVSSVTAFTMTDRGGISLRSAGNSPWIQTGYGVVQPSSSSTRPAGFVIYAYRSGNHLVSETSVPATPLLRSARIYAEIDGPVNTGVAIANPNNQAATIQFVFTDASGNDLGAGTTTIAANQQIARFLDAQPFKSFPGTTFHGAFSFTSDIPVAAIAIRGVVNERQDFLMSTLPVVDPTIPPDATPAVVPHFSDGGGWITEIVLMNPTNSTLTGSAEFHDDNGRLTNVTMGGQTSTSFVYAIAPRSSQKLATDGASPIITRGSVRIVPAGGGVTPIPLIVFSYKPGGIIMSEAGVTSSTGTSFRMYVESSGVTGQLGSIQSGIAIANTTSDSATVTLELTNLDGSTTALPPAATRTLPAYGHLAQFLTEVFPGLPDTFKGIVRVSGPSAGISVVGLRSRYNEQGDFLITTTPPATETMGSDSTDLLFPHLADGGGYTTQFVLFGDSAGQTSSGSLVLIDHSGQPFGITLR